MPATSSRSRCSPVHPWAVILLLIFLSLSLKPAHSAEKTSEAIASASGSSPAIVVGFVGGFVRPDDVRHAEVQLAQKLRTTYADRMHAEVFDNRHRKDAHRVILKWLDIDADGDLSDAEKSTARIILYGHSWGAAAAISLARELQRENIPVLLTVQVDSIAKIGQNDRVVPANVAKAVNFYQPRGLLHGRSKIVAADPTRTEILGEFRLEYKKAPAECREYPWLDRHLFKGHTAIECDPQVWLQIGNLIDTSLSSGNTQLAGAALR
ncbi:MAG: hypothetical protein LAO09_06375 [Acidobacteriia bacterium]|nr:hypothetical protein [Terriglobia bacterium]